MRVLVTGGAGYIGSHFVHWARHRGLSVAVLDDLRRGFADAVPSDVPFFGVALEDRRAVREVLAANKPDAIVHFASRIEVGESVKDPTLHFCDNVGVSAGLLAEIVRAGIKNLVFSSSAAVYGDPGASPVQEDALCTPLSAYGESKLAVERMLPHLERAHGMRAICLRYFNAAGAEPAWGLAERHEPETHLIPLALDAALGQRPPLALFGQDYPTPDGTAVRDYVHVIDLARAHELALHYLIAGGASAALNVGTGRGYSVREVFTCIEQVTGLPVPHHVAGRRPGDPPLLVAAVDKIQRVLDFRAERSDLASIVHDAWRSRQQ